MKVYNILAVVLAAAQLVPCLLASEMNTLIGVKGRDFVLLGGDSAFFRSMVVMEDDYKKVVELADNIVVAAAGDQGDVEMFVEWLKRNLVLLMLESSRPVGVSALANFARRNLAGKLRERGGAQAVTALLGGWNEGTRVAELYWLDSLGTLQQVPFGAHGLSSRFALALLDSGYREGLSLPEAAELVESCFQQLEGRYLVSSVGFTMKVVDGDGCRDVWPGGGGRAGAKVQEIGAGAGVRGGAGTGAG
ncbi:unnamed protein product, partial [Discosporangium mesarthrocarpum]